MAERAQLGHLTAPFAVDWWRWYLSKYDAIADFLVSKGQREIRIRFTEVESALGFSLPASARKYPEWWANNQIEGRHCNSWMGAGWTTCDVDLGTEKVTFVHSGSISNPNYGSGSNTKRANISKKNTSEKMPTPALAPDGKVKLETKMFWLALGQVTLDEDRKLVFPFMGEVPGLYRMRLQSEGKDTRYIGETANLRRRFAHYKNPGPTQSTNIRINSLLVDHIFQGNIVTLDAVTGGTTLIFDGEPRSTDLSDKSTRRLFEHAAIVFEAASDVKSLNL